jgi:hypothetical protein
VLALVPNAPAPVRVPAPTRLDREPQPVTGD